LGLTNKGGNPPTHKTHTSPKYMQNFAVSFEFLHLRIPHLSPLGLSPHFAARNYEDECPYCFYIPFACMWVPPVCVVEFSRRHSLLIMLSVTLCIYVRLNLLPFGLLPFFLYRTVEKFRDKSKKVTAFWKKCQKFLYFGYQL